MSGSMSRCRAQEPAPPRTITLIDALQATLDHNFQLQESRTGVQLVGSRVLRESDVFDTNLTFSGRQARQYYPLTDYEHYLALSAGINTYEQATNYSDFLLQGSKLTESGTRLFTRFDMSRNADNLENLGGVNTTSFQAGVQVPLLGGKGRIVNTAPVRAAQLDLKGATDELNGKTAVLVEQAAEQYFALVGANERVQTARNAEVDAQALAQNVEDLIRGDKLPAVDINDARASLEQARARTFTEEESAVRARMDLGAYMGMGALESEGLAADEDGFKNLSCEVPQESELPSLIAAAVSRRREAAGAHEHLEAAMATRDAAADAERRHLDLNVDSGYTGLSLGLGADDLLRSLGSRIGGANAEASLTYHFDAGHKTARADFTAAQASVTQLTEQEQQVERNIGADVVIAASNLRLSYEEMLSSQSAEDLLRKSVEGERTRLAAGEAVLNDVLTVQRKLFDAQLDTIQSRLRFAQAIARMRLATGTVFGGTTANLTLDSRTFYSCGSNPGAATGAHP